MVPGGAGVSSAAPPAVLRAAAALPPGPALVFDVGLVKRRMIAARAQARAHGVELLLALKAVPLAVVAELATRHLDGLDLAGPEEQARAAALPPTALSLTWPGDVEVERVRALATRHRVTVVVETAAQLAAAAAIPGVLVAARLADGPGSRFGVMPDALPALVAAGGGRVRALHVHGGALATAPAVLAERARRACDAATAADLPLEQLDLGGSLHGFALEHATAGRATLAAALAAARAAVPAAVRLVFEPGRLWTEDAGFAVGRVLAAREVDGQPVRVLDLSRLCHLRWSTPRLVAPPPRAADERVAVRFWGATCCEDDVIADAWVPAEHLAALEVGAQVLFAGVSGYAAGWNRAFAGVPAARVETVA